MVVGSDTSGRCTLAVGERVLVRGQGGWWRGLGVEIKFTTAVVKANLHQSNASCLLGSIAIFGFQDWLTALWTPFDCGLRTKNDATGMSTVWIIDSHHMCGARE